MKKKNVFLKNKTFLIFGFFAILIFIVAVFAPVFSGGIDPTEGDLAKAILPPGDGHIFGTDKMGRDIFARVIYGARISLSASFSVVIIVAIVGTFPLRVFRGRSGCCDHAYCRYDDRVPGSGTCHGSCRHSWSEYP